MLRITGNLRSLIRPCATAKTARTSVCCLSTTTPLPKTFVRQKNERGGRFKKNVQNKRKAVIIEKSMTIPKLARVLNADKAVLLRSCQAINRKIRPGTKLQYEFICEVVSNYGFKPTLEQKKKEIIKKDKDIYRRPPPADSVLVRRSPVVTIMGHVDHGKTTLLDTLRNSRVVDQEFGGITQHLGAFSVELESGKSITFLDTPGHAAFSAMRERGANVTDIAVIVVAAEDGVMKQTKESIQFAREAGVSIIVAINKIDKPNADVEKTKKMLLEHGLQLEDEGGDIQCVPISALKGTNIDALKESIIAEAELLDLKCDPTGRAEAAVIESTTHPGKGRVATTLIERGTLKKGAYIVAGTTWAKVRSMQNSKGRQVQKALPSTAVEVTGWKELPSAGDLVLEVESEREALEVVKYREGLKMDEKAKADLAVYEGKQKEVRERYVTMRCIQVLAERAGIGEGNGEGKHTEVRECFVAIRCIQMLAGDKLRVDFTTLSGKMPRRKPVLKGYGWLYTTKEKEQVSRGDGPELAVILKGDVAGSVDAILNIIGSYPGQQCRLEVVSYGVGSITEADLISAETFGAIIYGFNVSEETSVKQAKSDRVQIKNYNVIYQLVDDLKGEIRKQLPPLKEERTLGTAVVKQIFTINEKKKAVKIAGCKCDSGVLQKDKLFKVVRNNKEVFTGGCDSMRHFKDEVESIATDMECGVKFRPVFEAEPDDVIECFEHELVEQELDWHLDF